MSKRLSILTLGLTLALSATSAVLAAPDREFECLIEPNMMIEVSSPVDGVIDSIAVDKADVIEAGQVLAQLEASVQRAQVEQARARAAMDGEIRAAEENVNFTRRKLKRINDLYSSQAVAPQQKDEAETEARLASMELRKAKEDKRLAELELQKAIEALNQRTIRSPIEGVVVQRFLSPGESVKDKPIVSIAQIDPLRVEVILPAKAFGSIQEGMQAEIRPETSAGREYPAIVTIVDKVIDAASGTFGVRLELPNPEYALPGGLNCRVTFRPDLPLKELPPRQTLASGANGTASPDVNGDVLARDVEKYEKPGDAAVAVPTCLTVGPLPSGAKTDRLIAAIEKVASRVDRAGRASADGASRFLVLSAPQPSEADARSLAQQMRDKGVSDIAVLLNGQYQHRISLGVFSSQQNALARQKQVQALGFGADVISRGTTSVTRGGGVNLDVEVRSEADVAKVEQLVGAAVRGRPPVERTQCPQAMSAALRQAPGLRPQALAETQGDKAS
jgi:RND family efflux transporter MFP subunit